MKRATKSSTKEPKSPKANGKNPLWLRFKNTISTTQFASQKILLVVSATIIFLFLSYDDYKDPHLGIDSLTGNISTEANIGSFQKHRSMLDKIFERISNKKLDISSTEDQEFFPKVPPNPGIMDPGTTSSYLERDDNVRVDKILRSFILHYNISKVAHFGCSRNETYMMLTDEHLSSIHFQCYCFSQHKALYVKKVFFYQPNIHPSVFVIGNSKIYNGDLIVLYDSIESLSPEIVEKFMDIVANSEATWLISTSYERNVNPTTVDEEKIFYPYNLRLYPFYMDYYVLQYPRIVSSKTNMFRGKELLVYRIKELREKWPLRNIQNMNVKGEELPNQGANSAASLHPVF